MVFCSLPTSPSFSVTVQWTWYHYWREPRETSGPGIWVGSSSLSYARNPISVSERATTTGHVIGPTWSLWWTLHKSNSMTPKKQFGLRENSDYEEENALVLVILFKTFVRITRSLVYDVIYSVTTTSLILSLWHHWLSLWRHWFNVCYQAAQSLWRHWLCLLLSGAVIMTSLTLCSLPSGAVYQAAHSWWRHWLLLSGTVIMTSSWEVGPITWPVDVPHRTACCRVEYNSYLSPRRRYKILMKPDEPRIQWVDYVYLCILWLQDIALRCSGENSYDFHRDDFEFDC